MILCLDVGNTNICGGVFYNEELLLRFRYKTDTSYTSDQLGVFLKNVLRENSIEQKHLKSIAICSVVPAIDYSMRAACKKYFDIEPFILQADRKNNITIKTNNPQECGTDLIAGGIAAINLYPEKNIIVIDFGTITTLTAISKKHEFLGAAFLPGVRTTIQTLGASAAKLFSVEILLPEKAVGRSTTESIQSGVYYGHIGAIKEITAQIAQEAFKEDPPIIIATGGFCYLFENKNLFNYIEPDLIFHGLKLSLLMNSK